MRAFLRALVTAVSVLLFLGPPASQVQAQVGHFATCPPEGCITGVTVTPDGGTDYHPASTGPWTLWFDVRNTGNVSTTFTLTCTATAATCGTVNPTSATLAAGAVREVSAQYTMGTSSGKITLRASNGGSATDVGFVNVNPFPAPTLSLAPYGPAVRDVSECVATCFDFVWSHATPAYVSLDVARSVELVYNSATARPVATVEIDVHPGTATLPTGYQVQVRRQSDNVLLTLMNGTTSAYYAAQAGFTRVAAAVDTRANSLGTDVVPVTVSVTSLFPSGASTTSTVSTRLIFVDLSGSPFGAGFYPAGVQRYYGTSTGPLVLEGGGSIFHYAAWATPGGTTAALTTDGATWVRRTYLDGAYVEFDYASGSMRKAVDRFGNTTTLSWSGVRLLSITDPVGKVTTFGYDASNRLASITDPSSRVTQFTVTAANRLTTIRDPDGQSTNLSYNSLDLITSVNRRTAGVTTYAYDGLNKVRSSTGPSVAVFSGGSARRTSRFFSAQLASWQPGSPGTSLAVPKIAIVPDSVRAVIALPGAAADTSLPAAMLSQSGLGGFTAANIGDDNTATNGWQTNTAVAGAWLRVDAGAGGRAATGFSVFATAAYAGRYDVQWSDDAAGWTTVLRGYVPSSGWSSARWAYAGTHRYWRLLLTNTPGAGPWLTELAMETVATPRSTYSLHRSGAALKIVDILGQTTAVLRDTMARPTSVTEPGGRQQVLTYSGYLLTQVREVSTGRVVNYAYNSQNDLTTITGDVVRTDVFYYTGTDGGPRGALKSVYLGNTSNYPILSAGAVLASSRKVDSRGRDSVVTDAAGHRTEIFNEPVWGNLRVRDEPGYYVQVHYDGAGRPDTVYDGGNGSRGIGYGAMNEVVALRNALGALTQIQYDPELTIARIVDPRNQVYKFSYNAMGELTARNDGADTTKSDRFGYDEAGNMRRFTNRKGEVVNLTYDAAGRVLSRGGSQIQDDSYAYDPAGRWMSAANGGTSDSLVFDPLGRLTREYQTRQGQSYQLDYTYDLLDRPTGRSLALNGAGQSIGAMRRSYAATGGLAVATGAGVQTSNVYDNELFPRQTLMGLDQQTSTWSRTQLHDGMHAVILDSFSVAGLDAQLGAEYGYDVQGRLWSLDTLTYRYDKNGGLVHDCVINGRPPVCEPQPFPYTGIPNYAYDAAGNRVEATSGATVGAGNRMTAFKGYTLGYDANGNVISKAGNGQSWTYSYDALNRMQDVKLGGTVVATFDYDAMGRRVAKVQGASSERYVYDEDQVILDVNGAGQVTSEYGWYPETDHLLGIRNGSWTGAVLTDPAMGATIRGIARASDGLLLKKYVMTPWGEVAPDTGVKTRFRLGGREYDQESGLYFMRSRYYDPTLGRFLSEDPIGLAGGLNLYRYAGNDPINARDPEGMGPCFIFICFGGGDSPVGGLPPGIPNGRGHRPRIPDPWRHRDPGATPGEGGNGGSNFLPLVAATGVQRWFRYICRPENLLIICGSLRSAVQRVPMFLKGIPYPMEREIPRTAGLRGRTIEEVIEDLKKAAGSKPGGGPLPPLLIISILPPIPEGMSITDWMQLITGSTFGPRSPAIF